MTKRKSLADEIVSASQSQAPHAFVPEAPQADQATVEVYEAILGFPDLIDRRFRFTDVNFPTDSYVGTFGEAVEAGWQVGPNAMPDLASLTPASAAYEYTAEDGKRVRVEALSERTPDDLDD